MHYYNTSPEAMEKIWHIYSDTLTFTDLYFHISELLAGHEEAATVALFSQYNYHPPFDFRNCRVLVTGLPQHIYHTIYDWGQRDSVCCFIYEYRPAVRQILNQNGYDGESYIFLFDGKKHYVTLFSQIRSDANPVLPMAQEINDLLQGLYERYLFDGPSEYSNFTAVSPLITSYDEISTAFFSTKNHLNLHFFHRPSVAIDDVWIRAHTHPLMHLEYNEHLAHFQEALYAADLSQTLDLLQTLFFEDILPTMSFEECDSFLLSIRNTLISYATVCGFPHWIPEELFQCRQYPHLWECHKTIAQRITQIIDHTHREKKSYCPITIDAILYIRTHYSDNIYIESIADAIHTAPNYLSHVFKKDTGMTVHQYLTDLRIHKAQKLLTDPSLKTQQIAEKVGFSSAKYFNLVFRKAQGISPADYRKMWSAENPSV